MKLEISELNIKTQNKVIIKDLDLSLQSGEIHAVMGPNGAGKSSLIQSILGNEEYIINSGRILCNDIDITSDPIDVRAKRGIFASYQNPVEIPGVRCKDFIKAAVNSRQKYRSKENIQHVNFLSELSYCANLLSMNENLLERSVNDSFSGGEKKKFEILQMLMLKPSLIMLDEIDSGLDVDAFEIVTKNILKYHHSTNCTILIITHHQKILRRISPKFVHIIHEGQLVKSGNYTLAEDIEKYGYEYLIKS